MNTLLLDGILPQHAKTVNDLSGSDAYFFPLIMCFIVLSAITVMYMLIGVLVDVISSIAAAEKEGMTIAELASELRKLMSSMDRDADAPITLFEFRNFLHVRAFQAVMHTVNVDVMVLADQLDVIYEDEQAKAFGLPFPKFIDLILGMRGSNTATVKDVKEQYKVLKKLMASEFDLLLNKLHIEFSSNLHSLEEMVDADFDNDEWMDNARTMNNTRSINTHRPSVSSKRSSYHSAAAFGATKSMKTAQGHKKAKLASAANLAMTRANPATV